MLSFFIFNQGFAVMLEILGSFSCLARMSLIDYLLYWMFCLNSLNLYDDPKCLGWLRNTRIIFTLGLNEIPFDKNSEISFSNKLMLHSFDFLLLRRSFLIMDCLSFTTKELKIVKIQ